MNRGHRSCRAPEAALPRVACKLYATNFIPTYETTPSATTIPTCQDAIVSLPDAYTASTRVDGVCRPTMSAQSAISDETCSCSTNLPALMFPTKSSSISSPCTPASSIAATNTSRNDMPQNSPNSVSPIHSDATALAIAGRSDLFYKCGFLSMILGGENR